MKNEKSVPVSIDEVIDSIDEINLIADKNTEHANKMPSNKTWIGKFGYRKTLWVGIPGVIALLVLKLSGLI